MGNRAKWYSVNYMYLCYKELLILYMKNVIPILCRNMSHPCNKCRTLSRIVAFLRLPTWEGYPINQAQVLLSCDKALPDAFPVPVLLEQPAHDAFRVHLVSDFVQFLFASLQQRVEISPA